MRTTGFFCFLAIAIIMLSSVAMVSCDRRLDDALDMAGSNREEKEVPPQFVAPDFIDVTDEYIKTTDVERAVPKELQGERIAYICVYDNQTWKPVHYGRITNGKVVF